LVTRNSNVSLDILADKLRESSLPQFDIALSRSFRPPKPAPASALHIVEQWGVPAEEVWFVGDGVHDLECSRAAGTVGVLIRNTMGHHTVREMELEARGLHQLAFDDLHHFLQFLMDEKRSALS
jgi:phosphoglycolate phosphatase-like HAD superfamily hydrolase